MDRLNMTEQQGQLSKGDYRNDSDFDRRRSEQRQEASPTEMWDAHEDDERGEKPIYDSRAGA